MTNIQDELPEFFIVYRSFDGSPSRLWNHPLVLGEGGALWSSDGNDEGGYKATMFLTKEAAELAIARSRCYAADHRLNWPNNYEIGQLTLPRTERPDDT